MPYNLLYGESQLTDLIHIDYFHLCLVSLNMSKSAWSVLLLSSKPDTH